MSVLSKAAYKSLYGSSGLTFPNNTTGEISEADMRQFGEDGADSAMFLSDNFIDEDSFATDSATKAPSQQSTKAYIATQVATGLQTAKITVSSAEILNLNSVPKVIVAAPGANQVVLVHHIFIKYIFVSAAYATNLTLQIGWNGTATPYMATSAVINQTSNKQFVNIGQNIGAAEDYSNKALEVRVATGNPTAGDSTMVIVVSYKVIDIS
jgi:hypothetical protein